MRSKTLVAVFLVLFLGILTVQTAASNSAGAPANTAKDGCTCHGGSSTEATVSLQAPTEFVPGQTYDLKVTLTGPAALPAPAGSNQGGFALQVSAGTLSGTGTVRAEEQFATHTTNGNDQRSWDLKWTAPSSAQDVSFFLSGNAANGDGLANQLDRWNKATMVVKAAAGATAGATGSTPTSAGAGSSGATTSAGDSAFLPVVVSLIMLVVVALWRRV